MQFKVEKYQALYKSQWDSFVSKAKNATFLFYRDFMEYHQDRFDDHSLLVFKEEKLVAVLPANVKEKTIYSHQGLTYGGVVTNAKTRLAEFIEIFRSILKHLNESGIDTIEIKLLPAFYALQSSDELIFTLFCTEAEKIRCDTFAVIDLQKPYTIAKGRMEGVKRGLKSNLRVVEENHLKSFWETILIPTLNNKHGANPVHTLEEITLLKEKFPDNIRQFNTYEENKLVAGTTVFITEQVVHSQYIAAYGNKNHNGSLDFLHHHLIKNVFAEKPFFDFGTFNSGNGTIVNSGLAYWKQTFGAQIHTQDFYSVKTKNYNKLDSVLI